MEEQQERQPLLTPTDSQHGEPDRRQSIVSFHEHDSGNPLEWPKKYKWFSVALLCMLAATVYAKTILLTRCHTLTLEQDVHLYWNCPSGW